jgi:hypothetical protein
MDFLEPGSGVIHRTHKLAAYGVTAAQSTFEKSLNENLLSATDQIHGAVRSFL